MLEWMYAYEKLFWWLTGISLALFAVFLVLGPWLVLHIPEDYFLGEKRSRRLPVGQHSKPIHLLLLAVKNVMGGILLVAGLAMLLLPGQGLLTILLGLSFMNFPGKFRIERWLISRGPVLRWINSFRRRKGRQDLMVD
ncbi:MAG: PGPGW domain-containing protein [Desulfohalobiaceae bacterium]